MANYYSWLVTERPFFVKDSEKFKRELEANGVHPAEDAGYEGLGYVHEDDGRFWLGGYNADLSVWDSEKDEEKDIVPIIQKHIKDGEVAAFMSVGQEKLRSVGGHVIVVTRKESKSDDLHSLMERLVREVTPPHRKVYNKLKHGRDIVG